MSTAMEIAARELEKLIKAANTPTNLFDELAGEGRTTETVKGNADDLAAHKADFDQLVSELAMVKLGEVIITGSSVTEVTFSGLNVAFGEALVLVAQLNYPNSGTNDNGVMLTLNKSPDNTYYKRQTSIFSSTAAHEQANNRTIFVQPSANPATLVADIGFATNGTSLFDGINTILVNYRASTADAAKNAINVMGTLLFSRDGYANSITDIVIRAIQANGLRTGSKFSLYKRK